MHHIATVTPREDFLLKVEFENGEWRLFDLKPYLDGPVFIPLQNEVVFRQVQIDDLGGLKWPNGADLCPNMIYMNSEPVTEGRSMCEMADIFLDAPTKCSHRKGNLGRDK